MSWSLKVMEYAVVEVAVLRYQNNYIIHLFINVYTRVFFFLEKKQDGLNKWQTLAAIKREAK